MVPPGTGKYPRKLQFALLNQTILCRTLKVRKFNDVTLFPGLCFFPEKNRMWGHFLVEKLVPVQILKSYLNAT